MKTVKRVLLWLVTPIFERTIGPWIDRIVHEAFEEARKAR